MLSDEKPHPRQIAFFRGLSPAAKWAIALQLQEQARWLKEQAVRAAHPDWNETEVTTEVCRIFLHART